MMVSPAPDPPTERLTIMQPLENLKNLIVESLFDADAVVLHEEYDRAIRRAFPEPNLNFLMGLVIVLNGVGNKIFKDFPQPF